MKGVGFSNWTSLQGRAWWNEKLNCSRSEKRTLFYAFSPKKENFIFRSRAALAQRKGGKGGRNLRSVITPPSFFFFCRQVCNSSPPLPLSPFPPLSSPKQSFSGPLAAGGGGGGARKHKWARDLDGKRREGEASTLPSCNSFLENILDFLRAFPLPLSLFLLLPPFPHVCNLSLLLCLHPPLSPFCAQETVFSPPRFRRRRRKGGNLICLRWKRGENGMSSHEGPETMLFSFFSESPSADAASRSSSSSLFFGARIFLHLARLSFRFSRGFGERDSRQGGVFGHLSGSSPIPLPLANTLEQVADGQKKRKEHLSKKGLKICSPLPLQKRGNSTLGKFKKVQQ